jgi:hypothetical protein
MIGGQQFWLWRAVDSEGDVQRRRDKAASIKLMLKKQGFAPEMLVRRSSFFGAEICSMTVMTNPLAATISGTGWLGVPWSLPFSMCMTCTALPDHAAGRFWPLGPVGGDTRPLGYFRIHRLNFVGCIFQSSSRVRSVRKRSAGFGETDGPPRRLSR